MKVAVVGASGRLGGAIVREFRAHDAVVALGRGELDITNDVAVARCLHAAGPDVVVNCAAFNAVDAAQENPVAALEVNAFGVRALARASAALGATFVHYSTDFVFDGTVDRPYAESDEPNPQSVYATSKLLGEWFAAEVPRHYVLRVESLFGQADGGRHAGSVQMIVERIEAGDAVPVFVDRTVSPTYVVDAAAATRAIVERALPVGLYHLVNSGVCTWSELAEEAARIMGRPIRLKPITLDSARLPARRPKYAALSNAKLAELGITMPMWSDALRRGIK
jgi:dTDP-4-dehydrorhamnose reductase